MSFLKLEQTLNLKNGKKKNNNIMRKNYELIYFEKNGPESHINTFKSLEIENYLKKIFEKKGFLTPCCKVGICDYSITIFLSTYNNKKEPVFKMYKKKNENFMKNLLKSLNKFTNNKYDISIITQKINTNNKQKVIQQKIISNYNKSKFEELNGLLFSLMTQKFYKSELLASFISKHLKQSKKQHNFFLSVLKENLTLAINNRLSKIKGIKILVSGRINNSTRSRKKLIKLGKIPLITKNLNKDYNQSTTFTQNGTIGIKVWIREKIK